MFFMAAQTVKVCAVIVAETAVDARQDHGFQLGTSNVKQGPDIVGLKHSWPVGVTGFPKHLPVGTLEALAVADGLVDQALVVTELEQPPHPLNLVVQGDGAPSLGQSSAVCPGSSWPTHPQRAGTAGSLDEAWRASILLALW